MVTSVDGSSAGKHFVGVGQATHACPTTESRHEGDMGNVFIDEHGETNVTKLLTLLPLAGPNSIIGHAVVLHSGVDDCTTQPAGNSGRSASPGVWVDFLTVGP